MPQVVFLVGYSDSGKTTLMTNLIQAIKKRGYRLAAIKHAAHGYTMDKPGSDSWLYTEAGADQTIVVGPNSFNITVHTPQAPELEQILRYIQNVDIVLVEGFKNEPGFKIEVFRSGHSIERMSDKKDLRALVSDVPIESDLRQFRFSQVEDLADYILAQR